MSKRIEIIGNSIVVTDTVTDKIFLDRPAQFIYFDSSRLDEGDVILMEKDGANNPYELVYDVALANAVNKSDVGYTNATFRDFAHFNMGATNGASGAAIIAFVTAERIASVNSEDLRNLDSKGCQVIIDITNVTATGSVTLDSGESDKATGTITLASAQALAKATGTITMASALANVFSTGTVTLASALAHAFATGTVTCATVIQGNTLIANGNVYTAVDGAKLDNTEFSVDTGNNECAADLADSINNDTRPGTAGDISANAVGAVVTLTSDEVGVAGNAVTLSSSGATLAVSGATFSGGVDADTLTVNALPYTAVAGVKSDNTEFSIDTDDDTAAADLADSINNDTRPGTTGDISASATLAVVTFTTDVAGVAGDLITLVSSDGVTLAVSGATFSGGVDADFCTVNENVYIAVAGAKADNTEFSIDTDDDTAAADLADSITNDTRPGTTDDVTASATLAVVTVSAATEGTGGNAITLSSSDGVTMAVSGATLANGTDADTVEVNNNVYTAVSGAKADNTEFSIDNDDDTAATDLADSITNDTRPGVLNDVTAAAVTDTVTATTSIGGTVGNATTLSSSDGGRLAVSGATFSGGLDNALVSSITVDSVEIMSGTEIFETDLDTTASNIADNINAHTSDPNYTAVANGAVITISSLSEGDALVVAATSAVIVTTDVDMSESGSATFKIQGKDPASGKYYDLLVSNALNAVSTTILRVHPSLTHSDNSIAKDGLPVDFRIRAEHVDALGITHSVGVNLLK